MARVSRPPGFDMTYRPAGSVSFGPPIRERWATLLYVAAAVVICAVILYGQNAPSNSWIFRYVVEGDRSRIISSSVCAIILGISAAAALAARACAAWSVHPDGIETRELLLPRLAAGGRSSGSRSTACSCPRPSRGRRRQEDGIRVELWTVANALPRSATGRPAVMLEKVALARAIPVEGAPGWSTTPGREDEQEASGCPRKDRPGPGVEGAATLRRANHANLHPSPPAAATSACAQGETDPPARRA